MTARSPLLGFIVRISLLTSLTALSIDTMLPALPAIGESLHVDNSNNLQLIITLVFLGMFFGELLFGPLSDSLGRKKALTVGIIIYCVGTVVAMTATTLNMLLIGRIIQGVGVSGPKIISRAMIRDQFEGQHMARVFSFIMTVFIVIPMIAPILGQYIILIAGWRSIFFLFLAIAIISYIWIMLKQPETLAPSDRRPIKIGLLLKTTVRVLKNPQVLSYGTTAGLTFAVLLLYLSTCQAIFEQIYNKAQEFPLYMALLATGFGIATLLNSKLVMKYGMFQLCIGAALGLVVLGMVSLLGVINGGPSFTTFIIGCYVLMFCVGLLFPNLSAMAMQPLGKVAGLGASLISAISSVVALPISIIVGRFFDNTLLHLSLAILICAAISLIFLYLAKRSKMEMVEPVV
ncbi:MAG: multidrug effflux MFS transporter [Desulfobulbaceae bacterium]|nr:multidrug effflux MFS transporter [Desulfobulbaceae bacterium]